VVPVRGNGRGRKTFGECARDYEAALIEEAGCTGSSNMEEFDIWKPSNTA
jgi:hypothetical protein